MENKSTETRISAYTVTGPGFQNVNPPTSLRMVTIVVSHVQNALYFWLKERALYYLNALPVFLGYFYLKCG